MRHTPRGNISIKEGWCGMDDVWEEEGGWKGCSEEGGGGTVEFT